MSELTQLVVFRLDEQRYALPLAVVERIVRAVEMTPLPNAPAIVLGVIDVAGRGSCPCSTFGDRFGLPEREIRPADQFLIAQTAQRTVVLVIDEAQGVIERAADRDHRRRRRSFPASSKSRAWSNSTMAWC